MEIKGKPGDTVWIRATLRKIEVTESGVYYFLETKGINGLVRFKSEDLKNDTEDPDVATVQAGRRTADEVEQRKKFQEVIDSVDAGKKKRERPRKATVEDLMHKADQAFAESPLYEDENRRKKDGR